MAAAIPFIPYILAAVAAVGTINKARADSDALKDQGQVADYNAAESRTQAAAALDVSAANQMRQRREAAQVLGRQRAAVAQSGTGFGGSNADLLERSETLVELDQLNIAYDGMLKSRGYTSQAEIDHFQGEAYRRQATNVRKSSVFSAFGAGASTYAMTRGVTR